MIGKGHFLPGGALLPPGEGGVNETYRGLVETSIDRRRAYVKLMPQRQLANELFAAALGHEAGLRLPDSFLVLVRAADYPNSPTVISAGGKDVVAFASADLGFTDARKLNLCTPVAIARFIRSWKAWPEAAAFDDWIANADRHPGNLLVGGPDEVWLIDHSHAFTGSDWACVHLVPNTVCGNQLCSAAASCLTTTEKFSAYAVSADMEPRFGAVDLLGASSNADVDQFLATAEIDALLEFVRMRALTVRDRIAAHLGLPTLGLGARA